MAWLEPRTETRWVHDLFYPKFQGTGHGRFCKLCWKQDEIPPIEEQLEVLESQGARMLSDVYTGVCNNRSSTAAMVNHVCAKHKAMLPNHVSDQRMGVEPSHTVDPELMRQWSTYFHLHDLQPVRMIDTKGSQEVLRKRLPGLSAQSWLIQEIDRNIADIHAEVTATLKKAKSEGARFVISADTWKPKMKHKRHYCAIMLDWTTSTWEHKSLCVAVYALPKPRNAKAYQ